MRREHIATLLQACMLILLLTFSGCINPFAPEEGDLEGNLWENQVTVGQALRNFQTAYLVRDSLRYADIIADEFVFQYWSGEEGQERYDQWYRETELRATGGLMRAYDHLDLRWGDYSEVDDFDFPDSTAEFYVTFSLSANDLPRITGFAFFRMAMGEDGKFRITMWRDDF